MNSPLVSYTRLSPNNSGQRFYPITRITPHCVVGQLTVEAIGSTFAPVSRRASSNYGIGADGRIGMFVPENKRSWCSSDWNNDQRAVTIECASAPKTPYTFTPVVYERLIELCTDICRRNNKTKLLWLGSKNETLNYKPAPDEMLLTVHRWFDSNRTCPGDWLFERMGELAAKVTTLLNNE